ncbi:MAG: glycosyl hydrolase, partial [Saprospiraceae bacterium]
ILWGANAKNGPKAPTGNYFVRFSTGAYSQTYPFKVKIDPNLKGVTEADLKESFDLASKIRDKESANNEAVIRIRSIRKQLEGRTKDVNETGFTSITSQLVSKITAIEEDLYQTKNRSGQDPLNFPIKLGNRISAVRRSLETGDAKPTAGVYKVFEELSKELDGHLTKLDNILKMDLIAINNTLSGKQLKTIE